MKFSEKKPKTSKRHLIDKIHAHLLRLGTLNYIINFLKFILWIEKK